MKKENEKTNKKKEEGITLVTLVITIIILIILATVTINAVFGDNGLIKQAEYAKDLSANSTEAEYEGMNRLYDEYMNTIEEDNNIPMKPAIPSTVEEAKESQFVFTEKTVIEDEHGNKITIPEGFKVPEDSGDTVHEGVVIEDVSASEDENVQGSQYVWIPVGKFIKDDGTESNEIVLGRYTFNATDGTPNLEQEAVNYMESTVINSHYTELWTYREGIESSGLDGLNATAKDLQGFIESVNENKGYYIGRYEASYASGDSSDYASCKAVSKHTTGYSTTSMTYSEGTLWNYITQINASKVAINTYEDSEVIRSDLINSYAWDTAIVYIQEAGNVNYANKTSENGSIVNSGENGDEVCKINDMASNLYEWTTEHAIDADSNSAYPCVTKGGHYAYNTNFAYGRSYYISSDNDYNIGFRLNLYF